jgi:hypothetical protein
VLTFQFRCRISSPNTATNTTSYTFFSKESRVYTSSSGTWSNVGNFSAVDAAHFSRQLPFPGYPILLMDLTVWPVLEDLLDCAVYV